MKSSTLQTIHWLLADPDGSDYGIVMSHHYMDIIERLRKGDKGSETVCLIDVAQHILQWRQVYRDSDTGKFQRVQAYLKELKENDADAYTVDASDIAQLLNTAPDYTGSA